MLKLLDRQDEMNKTILAIRDLRTQLQSLEKRLGSGDSATLSDPAKSIAASSADIRKNASSIEAALIQVNSKASEDEANFPTMLNSKLGYLQSVVDSADAAPTAAELAVFAELVSKTGNATGKVARRRLKRYSCAQRRNAQK